MKIRAISAWPTRNKTAFMIARHIRFALRWFRFPPVSPEAPTPRGPPNISSSRRLKFCGLNHGVSIRQQRYPYSRIALRGLGQSHCHRVPQGTAMVAIAKACVAAPARTSIAVHASVQILSRSSRARRRSSTVSIGNASVAADSRIRADPSACPAPDPAAFPASASHLQRGWRPGSAYRICNFTGSRLIQASNCPSLSIIRRKLNRMRRRHPEPISTTVAPGRTIRASKSS